ncbi:3-deoxy-8-phosphooctulonate synthase [Bacteroidota bacterium]
MFIIAGPCVVESKQMLKITASTLKKACDKFGFELIFKSSYKKANRTSVKSFTGIGDKEALTYLGDTGKEYGVKVLTDIHSVEDAKVAAEYVDVLQIPAFLSRQTDLLIAAGKTGKTVNIKKGQFMAPEDMKMAAGKVESSGNKNIMLTERGCTFGYHNLIVDFRSLIIMSDFGYPVIYDATHSLQQPSIGIQSGGTPRFIPALARAAAATGVDGIFFETHPNPPKAKSDSATQLPLALVESFLQDIKSISELNFALLQAKG